MSGSFTPFGFIMPAPNTIVTGLDPAHTSHTVLQDIGTNTHAQIDSHIAATSAHGVTGNLVGTSDSQTLTNKSIASADNTITISAAGGQNIDSLLDQAVTTLSNVNFLSVTTVGEVAGNTAQFNTEYVTNILGSDLGNTALINGVNPLTTNTSLTTHIADTAAHGATGAVVGTTNTQTLTNKTIVGGSYKSSAPDQAITFLTSALTAPRIVSWPDAGSTVVLASNPQTINNKALDDSSTTITDSADATKKILFDAGGTTATGTVLTCAQTANRVITFPDATTTLVGTGVTQTLTNKTLTAPIISTISNTGTLTLPTSTDTLVGRATTDTLTNKTFDDTTTSFADTADPTKLFKINVGSGSTTGTTMSIQTAQTANRTLILPDISSTLVALGGAQTLVSKTLDSASNTLTITNSPLSAANVNALINQDIRTSATPTFVSSINSGDNVIITTPKTPVNAGAAGTVGQLCWDSGFIYICIATNTWHRVAQAAW